MFGFKLKLKQPAALAFLVKKLHSEIILLETEILLKFGTFKIIHD